MTEENLFAEFTIKRFTMDAEMPFTKNDGTKVILPMVILTSRELMLAKRDAERTTISFYDGKIPKKDEASSYDGLYEENLTFQLIFHSVRLPKDLNKKFFPTIDSVMDTLTPDQAGILKNDYVELQLNQPWVRTLNEKDPDEMDKVDTMIQRLIKDGTDNNFFLSSLSSITLNLLVYSLASRLKKCMTESGGASTPAEDIET